MKTLFLFSAISCMVINFSHAQRIQEIKAPITSVKICLNSAVITHTQKLTIKSGKNKFAFVGLGMNINSKNIGLRNYGNGELLSLSLVKLNDTTNLAYLSDDISELIRKSKDSLFIYEKNIEKLTYDLEGLQLERNMLVKNDDVIPNSKTVTLAEMKLTTEFYRERYRDVLLEIANKKRLLMQAKKNKVRALKAAFDVENNQEGNMNICVIMAEINNTSGEYSSDVELSYIAKEAGWIPIYDIASSNNKSLKINYRAKILNNTGIDWNNMNVSLSTADPMEYYAAPFLEPFYVNRNGPIGVNNYKYNSDDYLQSNQQNSNKQAVEINEEEIIVPEKEITFKLTKPYTFKSGKTPVMVDVTTYDIVPEYSYRTAPKKEEQVYSIAKIKDWEKLNLIDGEANIYNDGAFLGKCYIKPSAIDDKLELPLGVVDNIFVKHKLVNELSTKKRFSGTTATFSYEIKIKNNSSEKISIEVLDQVPVSESSSVKTDVMELTETGEKDPISGIISWPLELGANSEKVFVLKYAVSYPRGYSYSASYKRKMTRAKF